MGTYVDAYAFDIAKLKARLDKHYVEHPELIVGKMQPSVFLDIVMPEYGTVLGNYFIIVSNEHAEDYNAWFGLLQIFSRYYGRDPDAEYGRALFDLFHFDDKELGKVDVEGFGPEWKDADEWAELGIPDMPEEWDDE